MTNAHKKVLLVDDDTQLLRLLSLRLTSAGMTVETAESGEKALVRLSLFRPNVLVTDLRMDGMDGLALFDSVHKKTPTLPVIIMTAHGTIDDAVDATKRGVFSFITKPVNSKQLIEQIDDALKLSGGEVLGGTEEVADWRRSIVTQSPVMEDLLSQAQRVAMVPSSVFIYGQSGTGKELLARAIHEASQRRDKPFVAVNCSAIPENLLESELFGHKKGAFTGATMDHKGLFRAADGGTLFLDEIGDMPKAFQVKLLRALQEMTIRAVGAVEDVKVDVRIITATHVDLEKAMSDGDFREDLYYRLNVVTLNLPQLSERREDIPLLAMHFLQKLSESYGERVKGFSPEAMQCMIRSDWPGNVRQLHNAVEQSIALSTTPLIPLTLIQKALRDESEPNISLKDARDDFERNYLIRILQMTKGNVSQAAKLAQRNRTEFYRLLGRHALDPSLFKVTAEKKSG